MIEEMRVGLVEPLEVAALDLALEGVAAPAYTLDQHLDRRLQPDHQIRHRQVDAELLIDLLVEPQLVVVQIKAREQPILLEQEVGDAGRRKQVALLPLLHLTRALEQEEQLGRQRELLGGLVEALKERVLVRALQHQLAAESL
jgi:hypothetical protein